METKPALQEVKLPDINELYSDIEMAYKHNQLNVLLNQPPKKEWLKDYPMAKGVKYIPINRIEWLLTRIYTKWRVEVKNVQLIANSVQVTIRLHILDPISGEWDYQDGVGAVPLQTDKDAGAIEFNKLKNNSVMLAAPAAKSFAVKDAAEMLGKLFGKDINRPENVLYDNLSNQSANLDVVRLRKELSNQLSECQDEEIKKTVISETVEAEELGVNTSDFYNRMITKLTGKNGN